MLLKIKRAQKSSVMGSAIFTLHFKVEISTAEHALVDKYKLGKMLAYSSEDFQKNAAITQEAKKGHVSLWQGYAAMAKSFFNLKVSINDLIDGRTIEMKDLNELISAEEQIVQACNNMKGYLSVAKSFDGREETIEI